jgi:hypothetical protein
VSQMPVTVPDARLPIVGRPVAAGAAPPGDGRASTPAAGERPAGGQGAQASAPVVAPAPPAPTPSEAASEDPAAQAGRPADAPAALAATPTGLGSEATAAQTAAAAPSGIAASSNGPPPYPVSASTAGASGERSRATPPEPAATADPRIVIFAAPSLHPPLAVSDANGPHHTGPPPARPAAPGGTSPASVGATAGSAGSASGGASAVLLIELGLAGWALYMLLIASSGWRPSSVVSVLERPG